MSDTLNELIDSIKEAMANLVTLEIVTAVGNVKFQPKSAEEEKIVATIDYSKEPKAILTKIDLLQGDVQTVFHEEFVTGNYKKLKKFHTAQEKQAHEIVKDNLAALERLFQLRNWDEITSATMHHSFRPPLPDLKSQKHQNSLLFHKLL
jgi:hypothetical protein